MTIAEPTTLVTDYLLGMLSQVCGVVMLGRNRPLPQTSITLWAMALMAAAVGSYAGGTYHGFQYMVTPRAASLLWTFTTISMGAASVLLLAAALTSAFHGQGRRWLIAAAAAKFAAYAIWMLGHDEFRYVIYEYGSTLVILLLLVITRRTNGVSGHRAFIASGILVSIAAALVQQAGLRLHQHFNHNDLMHVVQMGGVWLLFEGGSRLRDGDAMAR